jgi:crotonobetainyl-CoA:carnitine CoA-transferase CaiB-like acyl-CoA transferase
MSATSRPLRDIRVLDLSQGIAGPSCGMHLAEYGARVIKVEPPEGDWGRTLGAKISHSSVMGFVYNRGKESLCLDLKAPEARAIVKRLAKTSDVFLQSARPGALDKLGLGFEDIRRERSNVVYVSVSGLGTTGPARSRPLTDAAAQAMSGVMSVNRGRDGIPHKIDTHIVDNSTGLYAFQATVMALWGRKADTPAEHLDISLVQSATSLQAHMVVSASLEGKTTGIANPPTGSYATADGFITIAFINEEQWRRFARAVSRPDLAESPRYATFAARIENLAELRPIMDGIMRQRPNAEWLPLLEGADLLVSPVNTYTDWLAHEQAIATNAAPPMLAAPGVTVQVPRTPGRGLFDAHSPAIGEQSCAILAEIGYAPADIAALAKQGVVKLGPAGG